MSRKRRVREMKTYINNSDYDGFQVIGGSLADRAGLRNGDVVEKLEGLRRIQKKKEHGIWFQTSTTWTSMPLIVCL